MDQRDLLRRLCNILLSSNSNEIQSNPDSLFNTLLINAVGHLVLKRRTNKSTQTDFNVQRIKQNNTLVETQHLLPLYKLHHLPRKNQVSNSVLKNDVYATNPKLHLRSPESHSRKKKKKRKDHRRRRRSRSKSRRSKKKKGKRSRSSRSDRSPSPDRRSTTKEDKLNEPLKIDTTTNQDILEVDQPSASSGIGPSPKNDSESPKR